MQSINTKKNTALIRKTADRDRRALIVMGFRDALSPRNGSRAALLVDGDKHEFAFGHFDRFAVVG